MVIFLAFGSVPSLSQHLNDVLPDAPLAVRPSGDPAIMTRPILQTNTRIQQHTFYRVSFAVLAAGEALDSWSTYVNLTHEKWICGYSNAFGSSTTFISDDGKYYDSHTVRDVLCGPSPSAERANYAYDVTRTGAFTETSWVRQFRLAAPRNYAGVAFWNLGNDAAQFLLARYLGKRVKGVGKFVGPSVVLGRGLVHLEEGILNIRFLRSHNDPNAWQFGVPNEASLFPGPRWWGKQ